MKDQKGFTQKGFTLMELMIVVAIIGILSAIAVPNFMNYRNKAYCTRAETDAHTIAMAIAEYYADPSNVALPAFADLNDDNGITLSGDPENIAVIGTVNDNNDISAGITIEVTDSSGLCPAGYQEDRDDWDNDIYTLTIFN